MNKAETQGILALIKAAWPNFYRDMPKADLMAAVNLWQKQMEALSMAGNSTFDALFLASLLNPQGSAETGQPVQRRKSREPAYLNREDFTWDGEKDVWLRLANAVVIQAEMDWQESTQRLKINPDDEEAKSLLKDAEEFFLPEDYLMFTRYDGRQLLARLKKQEKHP